MLAPEMHCVVGIDVARAGACGLRARGTQRGGAPQAESHRVVPWRRAPKGYAQVRAWLESWGTPETILLGLEATGPLWEPLYDTLTHAGYTVLLLNPRQTASWAASLGLRARNRWIGCADAGAGSVGGVGTGQLPALSSPSRRCAHSRAPGAISS